MKLLNVLALITLIAMSHCFRSSIKLSSRKSRSSKQVKINTDEKEQKAGTGAQCIQPTFLSDALFEVLLSNIKKSTPEQVLKDVTSYYTAKAGREMLSPKNAIRLFTEVDFEDKLDEMLVVTREYLWLSSEDLKEMVVRMRDLNQRTIVVTKLFNVLIDHNQGHFDSVTDLLNCNSKDVITELLKLNPKPKDCFFGDLSGNTVFVIDLSGSMMFTLKYEGEYITRLLFLKKLFKRAINSLAPEQKFQIITFSTNAKYLFGGAHDMYAATEDNKEVFVQTVFNLKAGVGQYRFTNISEGLQFALKIERSFDRIIFFTDGLPTVGIQNPPVLTKEIVDLNKAREKMGFKQVPINTNLLMLGKGESADFRKAAKYYSKLVASASNGTLKNFDSEVDKQ